MPQPDLSWLVRTERSPWELLPFRTPPIPRRCQGLRWTGASIQAAEAVLAFVRPLERQQPG